MEDTLELEKAILASGFIITQVISGGAQGADSLGAAWAVANKIPCTFFIPNWELYGKAAGPIRNQQMAAEGEALILVWDGKSRGSNNMLMEAHRKGLKVYSHLTNTTETKKGK